MDPFSTTVSVVALSQSYNTILSLNSFQGLTSAPDKKKQKG